MGASARGSSARGSRRYLRQSIPAINHIHRRGDQLAKPNYQYEKRQKDLAKKKKQEEKRLRKLSKNVTEGATETNPDETPPPAEAETKTP
jgi:hypothetical protein